MKSNYQSFTTNMKKELLEEEIKSLRQLFIKSKKEMGSFDYIIQVREGNIKRTIISEVYNGTDFED